jgi:hypothetical protein
VRLIYPGLDPATVKPDTHDIAAVLLGTALHLNTLGDLTKRENRVGRILGSPYQFPVVAADGSRPNLQPLTGRGRDGTDVILDNVLSFDVKAYDPGAPLFADPVTPPTYPVSPGDLGYPVVSGTVVAYGAYGDLGYWPGYSAAAGSPIATFYGSATPKSKLSYTTGHVSTRLLNTYDTFSLHYENDGVNEDGDTETDEGVDGLDSDNANGVDDPGEYETESPYPAKLRGVQVKVRVYEPDTRQVREVTVVQDYLPQ